MLFLQQKTANRQPSNHIAKTQVGRNRPQVGATRKNDSRKLIIAKSYPKIAGLALFPSSRKTYSKSARKHLNGQLVEGKHVHKFSSTIAIGLAAPSERLVEERTAIEPPPDRWESDL